MSYYGNNSWIQEVAKGNVPNHSIVHKFGRNTSVPNGSWELVANLSGATPFLSAATTVRVKAGGSANDIASTGSHARTLRVYGIDDSLAFADEVINLNGASASTSTTTSFWRLYRGVVETAGTYATPWNDTAIIVEDTAGTTDLLNMSANESQTKLGWYQWATGYDAYILSYTFTVDSNKPADIRVRSRANFNDTSAPVSPIKTIEYFDGIAGVFNYIHETPDLIESGPAELWVEANGSGAATEVTVDFEMLLVQTA